MDIFPNHFEKRGSVLKIFGEFAGVAKESLVDCRNTRRLKRGGSDVGKLHWRFDASSRGKRTSRYITKNIQHKPFNKLWKGPPFKEWHRRKGLLDKLIREQYIDVQAAPANQMSS